MNETISEPDEKAAAWLSQSVGLHVPEQCMQALLTNMKLLTRHARRLDKPDPSERVE